jgi:hypothetical protein
MGDYVHAVALSPWKSLLMKPGAMALTVVHAAVSSRARLRVSPSSPALAAA